LKADPALKIYYINLGRATDKRAFMERQLRQTQIPFERIEAIDGSNIDLTRLNCFANASEVRRWGGDRTPGALGCSLSHLEVYRRIRNDGIEVAVILEDDVTLLPDFASVVRCAASVVEDENIYLVYFHSGLKRFYRSGSIDIGGGYSLHRAESAYGTYSSAGYLLTNRTAADLASYVYPIHTTADNYGLYQKDGVIRDLWAVLPPPTTGGGFVSDIGYGRLHFFKRWLVRSSFSPVRWPLRMLLQRRAGAKRSYELVDKV
jgi:glycosyl transferase, family 25